MEATFEAYVLNVKTKNAIGKPVLETIEIPRKTPMAIFAYLLMASLDIPMGSSIEFFNENDDCVYHNDEDNSIDIDNLFNELAENGPLFAKVVDELGNDGTGNKPCFEPFTVTLTIKRINKTEKQQTWGTAKILEYNGTPIWIDENKMFSFKSKDDLISAFNGHSSKLAIAYLIFETNPEIFKKVKNGTCSMDEAISQLEEQIEINDEIPSLDLQPKGVLN